jgi:hypothetical protein
MSDTYLFTIIVVNEKKQIIDGQHRFEAIKELKFPLRFVVEEGLTLCDVHTYNRINKTWNPEDFLNGYCDLKIPEYLKYREFKKKYDFGHRVCMSLLSQVVKTRSDDFKTGKFKIKNYSKACEMADKIIQIAPLYKGYKRRNFVYAMITLFRNKEYDHKRFIKKLTLRPTVLVDCSRTTQYLLLIEEIYNHFSSIKVNLRYPSNQENKYHE